MKTYSARTLHKKPLVIACALLPLLSLPALAEETDNTVEEVIVTASKRDQRLQDFSGSVSVINNFQNIKNIGDIASKVPGFNIVDAGPRNPTGLVIRGLRLDEVNANDLGGDGAVVSSYIDNIPLQGFFAPPSLGLKDMQQVEILRGPQGTLYGNSSVGGLIRYITAKPDLENESFRAYAGVSQTKHSDDLNYDTDIVVNSPVIDNVLGIRLMLGKTESQGFIDNPYWLTGTAEDTNDDETEQARLSALWRPTENFSLGGSYHYQKINVADRQATNESFTGDKYTASSRFAQPMEGELQLASLDAEYDFDWARLSASVSRYDYQHAEMVDQTDYFITLDQIYGDYYTTMDDMFAFNAAFVDVVKDSVELRLVSADEQRLRWLIGGFYSRDDLDVNLGDFIPGFAEFMDEDRPFDLDFISTQTEVLDEYSTYAEMAYDITPQWETSVGLRYFRYDDDLDVCYSVYPGMPDPYCESGDDVISDTLGKFSTRYKLTDQQSIYFTVAEGYRRGGVNILPPDSNAKTIYDPDTVVNYELGYRSSLLADRISINAAIYNMEWEHLQIRTTSSSGLPYFINAGDARSKGVELETEFHLSSVFTLRAGYSYTNPEVIETVIFLEGEGANIYKNDVLPGAPDTQWNLALDYNQSFESVDVDASISTHYFGEVYTAVNDGFYNYRKLDGYNTADVSAGVTLRNWRLGAFINNISNTRGITGTRSTEWYGEQGKFEYVTRPRTVGLSVTYQY
ncbi:MAG TPA: TonB-dependent receptor [Cellvibrio sp.]|nr:TonB-dependent receptor [Cellvibrio sp.]